MLGDSAISSGQWLKWPRVKIMKKISGAVFEAPKAHRGQFAGAESASGEFLGAEGVWGQFVGRRRRLGVISEVLNAPRGEWGCQRTNSLYNFSKSKNVASMSIEMIQASLKIKLNSPPLSKFNPCQQILDHEKSPVC